VSSPTYEPTRSLIRELTDRMLDAYVDWRETATVVQDRYTSWSHSPRCDRSLRYASYLAALDGEDRAAQNYAQQIREVTNALADELTPNRSRSGDLVRSDPRITRTM
jgi:hypothetical protein